MSSYGRNFSTRLFVQAAFTGLLAPAGSHGSTWLLATFALAAGAAVVGAVVRGGHERTRELVIGFEAVAVVVGAVGLIGGHYIPGTIVGIAALITALNHPTSDAGPESVPAPAQAVAVPPQIAPVEAPQFAAPVPQFAAPAPEYAAPVAEYAAAPQPAPEPVPAPVAPVAPVTGVRAMNILPGK
jgi:hypothetical protein